jgi:beta-lactamase regulating signal transducer with metallopeptidase domain
LAAYLVLYFYPASLAAEEISNPVGSDIQTISEGQNVTDTCAEAVALLKTQNNKISQELRMIKREIAALKDALSKPGPEKIFGGIGYIMGFLGIIFYFLARKKSGTHKE